MTKALSAIQHERIETAIRLGTSAYIESRRQQIKPFVDRNFSFKGAWHINKKAIGWDMARAPANLLWTPVYFFGSVLGSNMLRKLRLEQTAKRLENLPPGWRTDVEQELEWLLYAEFLELPFATDERCCTKNAWLEAILAQPEFLYLLEETLRPAAEQKDDPQFRQNLEAKLSTYIDNRKDVAEIASMLLGVAVGLTAFKQLGLGSLSLGQAAASALATNLAVSHFFLGPTLGGVFYSLFPAAASAGLLISVTGGVALVAGMVAAFSGFVTDPVQKALGFHQKKLEKLVDALENQLTDANDQTYGYKDGMVARLLDVLDMLAVVVSKAH